MLSLLFEPLQAGRGCALNVVIVPALGLIRPTEWLDSSRASWLQELLDHVTPMAHVWEYIYSQPQGGSLAQRLCAEGMPLLETLFSHCTEAQYGNQPLVLICHGTGGIALKAALSICRNRPFRYRPLIDVIAGAIFLGVPHFVGTKEEAKAAFDLLLKCQHKGIGRSVSSKDDIESLMDVCQAFGLINLTVPILSAYESKETTTHYNLFSKFQSKGKNQVVIPRLLGTLRTNLETLVDSHANHFDICKVAIDSVLYKECVKLFNDVMSNAPKRIAEASQPYITLDSRDGTRRSLSTAGFTNLEEPQEHRPHRNSLPISSPRGATGGSTIGSFELVPRETALEPINKDPTLPCFSLASHQKKDYFVGRRNVIKTMDGNLLPRTPEPEPTGSGTNNEQVPPESGEQLRSFAICGLGGIGKTELAVEYAYSRKDKFEVIFWLGADDANILATNFAQIAQQLELEDDTSDLAASRDVAMAWLSQPLRKKSEPETPENIVNWLIIFDNVDNQDVLAEYWPKFGRGSVLVTSRDPFAKHTLYVERGIDLSPLSSYESEKLMQRLTHVRADIMQQEALTAIAKNLDGLPLAIDQVSGVFRRLRLSYSAFLKYYNEEGIQRILAKHAEPTGSHGARSLATVWALDQLSKSTKALLQVICLLDPDGIPEELLIDKSGVVELEAYPKSMGDYFDSRSELVSSSLINQNSDLEKLSLHRLIQDTARAMMTKEELIAAYQAATSLIIEAWPLQSMKEHHSVARFDQCENVFPSVLRLKNGIEQLIKDDSASFPLDIHLATLLNDTGWYLFERGLIEEIKPFCELGLRIGELLKDKLGDTAIKSIRESHAFLGIALTETNEHSLSMKHKTIWLSMLQERKSESGGPVEDYELGYAFNEIGVAYGNAGMLDEAAEAFQRSIEIFQGLEEYEDTMLGWPEPNLGFIYCMQGKLDESEKAFVEILDIHAAAWGVDDTNSFKTGKILYGMGNVLGAQGRYDDSFAFHYRCFNQFKKVLGHSHHRIGDICHKIAGHYTRQGLYKEAEGYLNSALKIFSTRSYLINERARTTFAKGKLFQLMGLGEESKRLLSDAYRIRKQLRIHDSRPVEQLQETDFDELVTYWSR